MEKYQKLLMTLTILQMIRRDGNTKAEDVSKVMQKGKLELQ